MFDWWRKSNTNQSGQRPLPGGDDVIWALVDSTTDVVECARLQVKLEEGLRGRGLIFVDKVGGVYMIYAGRMK